MLMQINIAGGTQSLLLLVSVGAAVGMALYEEAGLSTRSSMGTKLLTAATNTYGRRKKITGLQVGALEEQVSASEHKLRY